MPDRKSARPSESRLRLHCCRSALHRRVARLLRGAMRRGARPLARAPYCFRVRLRRFVLPPFVVAEENAAVALRADPAAAAPGQNRPRRQSALRIEPALDAVDDGSGDLRPSRDIARVYWNGRYVAPHESVPNPAQLLSSVPPRRRLEIAHTRRERLRALRRAAFDGRSGEGLELKERRELFVTNRLDDAAFVLRAAVALRRRGEEAPKASHFVYHSVSHLREEIQMGLGGVSQIVRRIRMQCNNGSLDAVTHHRIDAPIKARIQCCRVAPHPERDGVEARPSGALPALLSRH